MSTIIRRRVADDGTRDCFLKDQVFILRTLLLGLESIWTSTDGRTTSRPTHRTSSRAMIRVGVRQMVLDPWLLTMESRIVSMIILTSLFATVRHFIHVLDVCPTGSVTFGPWAAMDSCIYAITQSTEHSPISQKPNRPIDCIDCHLIQHIMCIFLRYWFACADFGTGHGYAGLFLYGGRPCPDYPRCELSVAREPWGLMYDCYDCQLAQATRRYNNLLAMMQQGFVPGIPQAYIPRGQIQRGQLPQGQLPEPQLPPAPMQPGQQQENRQEGRG
jgi:hypothetical protein